MNDDTLRGPLRAAVAARAGVIDVDGAWRAVRRRVHRRRALLNGATTLLLLVAPAALWLRPAHRHVLIETVPTSATTTTTTDGAPASPQWVLQHPAWVVEQLEAAGARQGSPLVAREPGSRALRGAFELPSGQVVKLLDVDLDPGDMAPYAPLYLAAPVRVVRTGGVDIGVQARTFTHPVFEYREQALFACNGLQWNVLSRNAKPGSIEAFATSLVRVLRCR